MKGYVSVRTSAIRNTWQVMLLLLMTTVAARSEFSEDLKEARDRIQKHDPDVLSIAGSMLSTNDMLSFKVISRSLITAKWEKADDLIEDYLNRSSDSVRKEYVLINLRGLQSTDRFKRILISLATNEQNEASMIIPSVIGALEKTDGPEVRRCFLHLLSRYTCKDFSVRNQALEAIAKKDPDTYDKLALALAKEDRAFYEYHRKLREAKEEAERKLAIVPLEPLSEAEKARFADNLQSELHKDLIGALKRVHATFKSDRDFFNRLEDLYRKTTDAQVRGELMMAMMASSEEWFTQFLKEEKKRNPDAIKELNDFLRAIATSSSEK